jgi:hypothetical protein
LFDPAGGVMMAIPEYAACNAELLPDRLAQVIASLTDLVVNHITHHRHLSLPSGLERMLDCTDTI